VHVEIASADPERTKGFLREVFGWEFESVPGMPYFPFSAPNGPGGAVMPAGAERPPGVLNYILSDDIEADLRRIGAAGGKVLLPRTEVPNLGWWALFSEPAGTILALYQSSREDRGPTARFR